MPRSNKKGGSESFYMETLEEISSLNVEVLAIFFNFLNQRLDIDRDEFVESAVKLASIGEGARFYTMPNCTFVIGYGFDISFKALEGNCCFLAFGISSVFKRTGLNNVAV